MVQYSIKHIRMLCVAMFTIMCSQSYAFESSFISQELVHSFTGAELAQAFSEIDPMAATIASSPNCGVDIYRIRYFTIGSRREVITSTAAVMIPNGADAVCQGQYPTLLHAHGTTDEPFYDLSEVANINNSAAYRSTNLALNFASQGYIVIAPNYAGYDESSLDYHPYLSARQQANEMYDVYLAAKQMFSLIDINTSHKLFISGYSQGGYVALASSRFFAEKGEKVTAVAPMSGPYALLAFGDHIFKGNVNVGANFFIPLLTFNYEKEYGSGYINVHDIFQKKTLQSVQLNSNAHWSKKI